MLKIIFRFVKQIGKFLTKNTPINFDEFEKTENLPQWAQSSQS